MSSKKASASELPQRKTRQKRGAKAVEEPAPEPEAIEVEEPVIIAPLPTPSIPSPPTPPPQIDDAVIEVERPASPSAAEAGDLFSLSEEDRRKLRKERFGENEPVTLDEKRSARAQRFAPYIATPVTRPSKEEVVEGEARRSAIESQAERRKARAERFLDPNQKEEAERRKARAERFSS